MKKFMNAPTAAVREALEGMIATDPGLMLLEGETVILRADIPDDPARRGVALISGGGAGHEPAHAGYVGAGMLSAAVAGDIFTSPSVDAVLAGIHAAAGPAGALLIVKNYTGDRLNFTLAAELARAEGIPTEVVLVADDVALRGTVGPANARGIAGTVLVHKAAGAAAARGAALAEVVRIAQGVAGDVVSMGVALGGCTIPGGDASGFTLAATEIEYGLGIHGEKGLRRGPMAPADGIVRDVVAALIGHVARGEVGLLVNGLGGTTQMELSIVARAAMSALAEAGYAVRMAWTGSFMTALDMPGISLSVLPLDAHRAALLADRTAVRAWPISADVPDRPKMVPAPARPWEDAPGVPDPALRSAVLAVADALDRAEGELTRLDAETGDGDLGHSMARAAQALRGLPGGSFVSAARLLAAAGMAMRRAIGGSSGPFYAIGLLRAAQRMEGAANPTAADWRDALSAACDAIHDLGGARPGDRTMLDALHGAWTGAGAASDPLAGAAEGARAAAEATARMAPKLGRASYLGDRAIGHADAGAAAVAIWMTAIADSVRAR